MTIPNKLTKHGTDDGSHVIIFLIKTSTIVTPRAVSNIYHKHFQQVFVPIIGPWRGILILKPNVTIAHMLRGVKVKPINVTMPATHGNRTYYTILILHTIRNLTSPTLSYVL